jgi:NhaP-type Na+/H+ or K+/H+ antiporter
LSEPEKLLSISAAIASIGAVIFTYLLQSPMPLALAFALGAVTVALLEVED